MIYSRLLPTRRLTRSTRRVPTGVLSFGTHQAFSRVFFNRLFGLRCSKTILSG